MTLNPAMSSLAAPITKAWGRCRTASVVDFEIQHIESMRLNVVDPLRRSWEKGIYMGADSTNPDAVRLKRPQTPR